MLKLSRQSIRISSRQFVRRSSAASFLLSTARCLTILTILKLRICHGSIFYVFIDIFKYRYIFFFYFLAVNGKNFKNDVPRLYCCWCIVDKIDFNYYPYELPESASNREIIVHVKTLRRFGCNTVQDKYVLCNRVKDLKEQH